MAEPQVVTLPRLPRSDSPQAQKAIEQVMAERNYPTSPAAAARAGWEAAWRLAEQQRTLTVLAQHASPAAPQT